MVGFANRFERHYTEITAPDQVLRVARRCDTAGVDLRPRHPGVPNRSFLFNFPLSPVEPLMNPSEGESASVRSMAEYE